MKQPIKKNQLYQDKRIETFSQIYVQIKMQVGNQDEIPVQD